LTKDKNHYLDLVDKESNDFGFSFADEEELVKVNVQYANLADEVSDLRKRLIALRHVFLPLLENLNREPDKPMIKWIGRKEVIDKQIKNLKDLTDI
jgi:hypothetical protein